MTIDIIKRNNVRIFGEGIIPMVFAHGFGCDQNMWRYITPSFEKDYKIILFDYVGCGKSDINSYDDTRYSSLKGYAQDIIDVCNALHIKQAILVAHSVSCMVGILSEIINPGLFSCLLMIGPSSRYVDDENYFGGFSKSDIQELLITMDKNYIGWANYLAPAIMGNPERPELGEELNSSFCSTDPKLARKFAEVTFLSDNRKDLEQVHIPTLIMQCADDIIASEKVGEFIHQKIGNSKLVYLNAKGHCPHLSEPGETITVIKEFLKDLDLPEIYE